MFDIGDLVEFKKSGIIRSRYSPDKKVGIITGIERNMFDSYDGEKQDLIIVRWMPWGKEERVMEFYLEHLAKSELENL